jgi:hypothetical protein
VILVGPRYDEYNGCLPVEGHCTCKHPDNQVTLWLSWCKASVKSDYVSFLCAGVLI